MPGIKDDRTPSWYHLASPAPHGSQPWDVQPYACAMTGAPVAACTESCSRCAAPRPCSAPRSVSPRTWRDSLGRPYGLTLSLHCFWVIKLFGIYLVYAGGFSASIERLHNEYPFLSAILYNLSSFSAISYDFFDLACAFSSSAENLRPQLCAIVYKVWFLSGSALTIKLFFDKIKTIQRKKMR